ncbi:hypothetical protein ACOIE4_001203 [Klebsiella variicola]|uniref:hypothetical protein n=1 Tax=Klebsiella variicola TaxID=244366 RepID=UPI00359F897B
MQKMVLALASIAVLFSGTAAARELTASEKKVIEESAKQKLKDPDSAKIYWQPDMGGDAYCAQINAKNSYGGYAGKALLLAGVKRDSQGKIIEAGVSIDSDDIAELMMPICTDAGYHFPG